MLSRVTAKNVGDVFLRHAVYSLFIKTYFNTDANWRAYALKTVQHIEMLSAP